MPVSSRRRLDRVLSVENGALVVSGEDHVTVIENGQVSTYHPAEYQEMNPEPQTTTITEEMVREMSKEDHGKAVIPPGRSRLIVLYYRVFTTPPMISITPEDNSFNYKIVGQYVDGFIIQVSGPPPTEDFAFTWIAKADEVTYV